MTSTTTYRRLLSILVANVLNAEKTNRLGQATGCCVTHTASATLPVAPAVWRNGARHKFDIFHP